MAKKKERPFDKLYAELEEIKDARGEVMNTVLFSKNGNWSVIIEIVRMLSFIIAMLIY